MEDLSLFGGDFSSHVSGVTFTSRIIDFNEIIILSGYLLISSSLALFFSFFVAWCLDDCCLFIYLFYCVHVL